MKSAQETWLIVLIAAAVFFGALSGGVAGWLVVRQDFPGSWQTADSGLWRLHEEEVATVDAVKSIMSSVVSILIEEKENGEWVEIGGGTGVVVSDDGLVLTNRHVVDQQGVRFLLIGPDEAEHEATLIGADPFLDLAVLKFDQDPAAPYPSATLGDSSALQIGQTVMAIGNTLSEFPNSVSRGIISGLNRTLTASGYGEEDAEVIDHAIQTDAAISEGNSGGPLINLSGEVIGITTAVAMDGQSLGFAIPINTAQALLSDIRQFGRVVRPWLGVRYMMIDRQLQAEYQLTETEGAYVLPNLNGEVSVIAGSPADKAGILPGDVILSVNNQPVSDAAPLGELVNNFNPGETMTLQIDRDGSALTIDVVLEEVDQTKL